MFAAWDETSFEDDDFMAIDLGGAASSKVATAATTSTSSRNMLASPPRAPKNPVRLTSASKMLSSVPLMSQPVHIPDMPRLPSNNNNKENAPSASSSKTFASPKNVSKVKQPPVAWIEPAKPSSYPASATISLPQKALQAPFTKKQPNSKSGGQTSLNGFLAKGDASFSEAESSFASTSSKKRSVVEPWEPEAIKPSKVPRSESSTSAGSKGKSKKTSGTGIGSLNVRQQIVLSAEQQKVLKMVVEERKNVFFTGSAGQFDELLLGRSESKADGAVVPNLILILRSIGTGKSILLREIISSLRKKYANKGSDRVAITASTGMAAANIGGTTIHSFAGIGLGQGTAEALIDFVRKNRKASGRWMRTEVLIIDEVSMVDGDLFDKLAHIAKRFRRKEGQAFGGIQLIMTGDFFQLPPVTKAGQPKFAFEAKAWKECIDVTVNLTKVFRQKDTGEQIDKLSDYSRVNQHLQSLSTCLTRCVSARLRRLPSSSLAN